MKRALLILGLGLFALACDKSEVKPDDVAAKNTTTGASAAVPTTTAAPTPTPPAIADSDLSTPADFEETAEKAISKTNYKKELASLEADIAKE